MESKAVLRCMFCDRTTVEELEETLLNLARMVGWHDINPVAPDGDEPGVTHHGTCPGCIWEHTAKNQAVS
jgi:hypothetical protein